MSLAPAAIGFRVLRGYYLVRRGITGSHRPAAARMRTRRHAFYRHAWQRAAERAGLTFREVGGDLAEVSRSGRQLCVFPGSGALDDTATLQRAGDKPTVYRLLAERGVPVPRHVVLDGERLPRLSDCLNSLTPPLVVKPARNAGSGAGVTTNVMTAAELRHAVAWARAFGPRVLVEAQVDGACYRVLVIDGEVADVVLRRRPTVTGDGRSTIRRLIALENRHRLSCGMQRAQVLLRRDPDLIRTLASQGLDLASRPAAGRIVEVKRVINDNCAAENEASNGRLCAAALQTACTAAAALGLRLAGIDLLCADPAVPLAGSGGAVIDVNATPGFYYHYHRVGPAFPLAERLLEKVLPGEVRHAI